MKIIDTFNDILLLKSQIETNPQLLYKFWKEYIEKYSCDLEQKLIYDSKDYSFGKDVQPIITACLIDNFNKLEMAHNSFIEITNGVNEAFNELFDCEENISIYFYCGLCNGAGWATTLNNNKVVLLGVEKIVELEWYSNKNMVALLYHELCHIAHNILRNNNYPNLKSTSDHSIWQLYREGFAMLCEQKLCRQDDFYHQDRNGWLEWCKSNYKQLAKEFLDKILENDSTNEFFGDWNSYKGYSDTGYFLGCEFVKTIEKMYSIYQIANFTLDELRELLVNYLKELICL